MESFPFTELPSHYKLYRVNITVNSQVNIMIAYEIVLSRYPNCLQQNFESLTSIGSRSIVFAVNRTSTIMSTPAKSTPTMSTPAEKGTYAPEPAEEDKYLIQYVTAFSGI